MGNTILITEDHQFSLKLLTKYFTDMGFTVFPAENTRDTIRLAEQHLPDCFLLDYNLGAETIAPACHFIRSHDRLKRAPILILSGESEKAEECYSNCRADVFIEKGGKYQEVLAAVNHHLRKTAAAAADLKRSDITLNPDKLCVSRHAYPDVQLSAEQFKFFSLLFKRSPDFVPEEEICSAVFGGTASCKRDAINMLAHRLRLRLGPQLGRRIKSMKRLGWIYVQPRVRFNSK